MFVPSISLSISEMYGSGTAVTSVIAGGSVIGGTGRTAGMVSVTAAEVDCGSAGSVTVSGDGVAVATESVVGSFIASTICKADGAGSVANSVIIGASIAAGAGGVVSSTGSGTAAGVKVVSKAESGAAVGSTAGMAESVTAAEVDSDNAGSVAISGNGVAVTTESRLGSFTASTACEVDGAGSAVVPGKAVV